MSVTIPSANMVGALKLLLEREADVDAEDKDGNTAL